MRAGVWPARTLALAALTGLFFVAAWPASAQEADVPGAGDATLGERSYPIDPLTAPRPSLKAVRTDEPIVIDGRLDEPAWALADVAADFVQNQPQPGHAASERTEVRVLYDSESLYISAVCHDSEMDKVLIPGLEREFDPRGGDVFALAIDPFHDERNSFVFISHPRGAERDEQTFDNSRQIIVAWEGVWDAEATMSDSAWIVEMEIPFATVRFKPAEGPQDWGINFARIIRRHNEWDYWAPLARHEILHQMVRAGDLTGFQGIEAGRNLQVKPYGLGGHSTGLQVPDDDQGSRLTGGLDLKYGLTPGLTMDLTVNTDFAQVELDEEQVNLTRFSLFFPERRGFFIENQGTFSFGDVTERGYRMGANLRDFSLFHSRRIGLTPDGRSIPIYGGGRVSGRVGRFNVGFLTMQTQGLDSLPSENFVVARVKRDVLGNSDVGVMFINRQATSGQLRPYNQSFGADANIRPIDHLVFNTYLAGTRGPGEASDGTAAKFGAAWRDNFWNTSFFVKQVDGEFNPAVGFIRRRDMRHFYATLGVHPQPGTRSIQEINPFLEADYITNLASVLETRRITGGLTFTLGSSAAITGQVNDVFERLDEPFLIPGGAVIQPGNYSFREAVFSYTSSGNGNLKENASMTLGGFWDGTRRALQVGAAWRPRYDLYLDLSLERNDVDLPDAAFTADVAGLKIQYAFNTSLFWSAFVQYNTQSDQLVTNLRGQFRYAPLSDFYVVFTERRDTRRNLTLDRSIALKATKMFAF
jgi:hypothetical protein